MKAEDVEIRRARVNTILYDAIFEPVHQRNLVNNLINNNVKEIAIYGAGKVGKALGAILMEHRFKVAYYVDKFSDESDIEGIPLLHSRIDYLKDVDALIITPCHEKYFIIYEIEDFYSDKCIFLSLDQLLEVQI